MSIDCHCNLSTGLNWVFQQIIAAQYEYVTQSRATMRLRAWVRGRRDSEVLLYFFFTSLSESILDCRVN